MKDPDDNETQELNFHDRDIIPLDGDEDLSLCPCCRQHELSADQEACQIEGEICTVCNFYEWEEV